MGTIATEGNDSFARKATSGVPVLLLAVIRIVTVTVTAVVNSIVLPAHAQTSDDTVRISWLDRIAIDASGATWYQPAGAFVEFDEPDYLEPRRGESSDLQFRWSLRGSRVSDNPL